MTSRQWDRRQQERRKRASMANTANRLVRRLAARCKDPGVLNPATAAASARSSRCPTLGEDGREEE